MARYIIIPPDMTPIDPQTDAPLNATVTFAEAVRVLFNDQRLTGALDVFTLIDLRNKLKVAKYGDPPVQISDEEWNAILPCAKRPTAFTPAFLYSCEEFFRAFTDAPTKAPAHVDGVAGVAKALD